MNLAERFGLAVMHRLDPERAHRLSLAMVKTGLVPMPGVITSPRLQTTLCGLDLPNPIGLAAGYDKNCEVVSPLTRAGFGFVECGAITPLGQAGNPAPRLFRLPQDQAVINRFGFNNKGMKSAAENLARSTGRSTGRGGIPVGLNLGANKDSADRTDDFAQVLEHCGAHIEFATINVSSPNTEGLRNLQGSAALAAIIRRVTDIRDGLATPMPIFVKIAPDLTRVELEVIVETVQESGADGIIATNTTLDRKGLKSPHSGEKGGLSGAPLFEKSTRVLAQISEMTGGSLPLIGVGGVSSAQDAYAKIRAGAQAVQLYSALVYQGLSLVKTIAHELDDLLARDGFDNVAQAVGTDREKWL